MSASDQVLIAGNVDGGQGTASGSVGGAGAPGPTGTPAVHNAAAGSAAVLANASVPAANGANILTALPSEVLHLIAMDLDLVALHSFRFSCKALRPFGDVSSPMSQGEYIRFQRQLEANSSRRLKHLYCPSCDSFKRPTPSRATFTDAQAVQRLNGRRICVECGIANGYYDRRDVVIKKKKLFLCGGCKLLLPHEKEETVVANVVFTKAFPWHNEGWGRGAEITIGSGRKRWCKPCRAAIANLADSGAVKVKQVDVP